MIVKTAVKQTDGLWGPIEKDCVCTGVLPKLNDKSANSSSSWNPINHWNMNWSQFKDPLSYCYLCLGGTMVTSWSLTLETVSLNRLCKFSWQIFFVSEFSEFNENISPYHRIHYTKMGVENWRQSRRQLVSITIGTTVKTKVHRK